MPWKDCRDYMHPDKTVVVWWEPYRAYIARIIEKTLSTALVSSYVMMMKCGKLLPNCRGPLWEGRRGISRSVAEENVDRADVFIAVTGGDKRICLWVHG